MSGLSDHDIYTRAAQAAAWPVGLVHGDAEACAASFIACLSLCRPGQNDEEEAAGLLHSGVYGLVAAGRQHRNRPPGPGRDAAILESLRWSRWALAAAPTGTRGAAGAAPLAWEVTTALAEGLDGVAFDRVAASAAQWEADMYGGSVPLILRGPSQRGWAFATEHATADTSGAAASATDTRATRIRHLDGDAFELAQESAQRTCWRDEGDPVARALEASLTLSPWLLGVEPERVATASRLSAGYTVLAAQRCVVDAHEAPDLTRQVASGLLAHAASRLTRVTLLGDRTASAEAGLRLHELDAARASLRETSTPGDLAALTDTVPGRLDTVLAVTARQDAQGWSGGRVPAEFATVRAHHARDQEIG